MNKLLTGELHFRKSAGLSSLMTGETTGGILNKYPPLRLSSLMTGETSKTQLLELAKRLGLYINAICYVDQLRHVPVPTSDRANYIINLREPAHWTALFIDRKKGYYFNSYSSIMSTPKEVIYFLKKCGCTMYYDSDKSVQKSSEQHCGEFCIDFLMHMNACNQKCKLNARTGANSTINYENFLSHLHSTNKENISYLIRHI